MTLSLRQVLALPVLRRAEPVVVAGEQQLGNPVRWLHVSEQEDVGAYLSGGEFLLTTGMRLRDDTSMQQRYVSELAEVGVAGVAVRLGGALTAVPPVMVREADQLGLPLVVLQKRIAFADAMEEVHGALLSEQAALLRRAGELRSEFNDLVLQGSTVQQLVERLATIVSGTVVVEDAARRPLHVATATTMPACIQDWARHSRAGHDHGGSVGELATELAGECLCAYIAIVVRGDLIGRIHVLQDPSRGFDELDRMAIERAASALVLAGVSLRQPGKLRDHGGSALLADLIEGNPGAEGRFRAHPRNSGATPRSAGALLAWAMAPGRGAHADADDVHIRQRVESAVRRSLGADALTGWYNDTLVAMVATRPGTRASTGVVNRLLDYLPESYCVGLSEALPDTSVRQAVLQSLEASRAIRVQGGGPRCLGYSEVGAEGLLGPAVGTPALARFVEGELGPLLAHDADAEQPLRPTLEALLRANARVGKAASELGIDRRTLAARLPQLERLLGVDLQTFSVRLRLSVALRALDLLEVDEEAGGSSPPEAQT